MSRQIIEQLQQDGRRAYATIAKVVGMSEAAVRQRVQRLLEAKVMQIVAVSDPQAMGFARQAMLGLTVDGDLEAIEAGLKAIRQVEFVVAVAGSFNLLVEVVATDDLQLMELLAQIRAVPGVESSETFVYLKRIKQNYNWGSG